MRRSVAVAALCALLPVVSCSRQQAAVTPPPPLVKVLTLATATDDPLELRGSVVARSRIRLGFKLPGVVAEVAVHEGEQVRKGQLLARLEDVDARAQWRMAVAHRDKAKRDADRAARLLAEGAVATGVRDDAASQLEAAEAQVTQAADALERTKLLAPAAGTVFARTAEPGETVGAGSPVLHLDTTGALLVKTAATERERRSLRPGEPARLVPESGPARPVPGRLTSLATTPSSADGLYALEITPSGALDLPPGALVRVRFEARPSAATLRIPIEALVHRQDRDFVFLLEGDSRVRQSPIEVGQAEGRQVVVRSGLSGGERIVAEGAYFLQNGQAVRTTE